MGEDLRAWYLDHLDGHRTALSAALDHDDPQTRASLRRIARNLRSARLNGGMPPIADAAIRVEQADEASILPTARALLHRVEAELLRARSRPGFGRDGKPIPQRTIDILIVDNDATVHTTLHGSLSNPQRHIHHARNMADFQAFIDERAPALTVINLALPDADGRAALLHLRAHAQTMDTPVIVLSPHDSHATRSECLVLGADAYFAQPANLDHVAHTVNALLRRVGRERGVSRQDPLTGLPNRRAFHEAFAQAQALAMRENDPLSLALIDFDWFKSLNDRYGHGVGDEVLVRGAQTIRDHIRRSDHAARWGGEEFVVLLPLTDVAGATRALENVLDALRHLEFHSNGHTFSMTASAGVAAVIPQSTLSGALELADRSLYRAKSAGRDQVVPDGLPTDRLPVPRVLLVDDRTDEVQRITDLMAEQGLRVAHAHSTREALGRARAGDIAMAVLAVHEADTAELDIVHQIRALPRWDRRPVLILSEHDHGEGISRAFAQGADDYLRQPWTNVELAARVQRLLERAG